MFADAIEVGGAVGAMQCQHAQVGGEAGRFTGPVMQQRGGHHHQGRLLQPALFLFQQDMGQGLQCLAQAHVVGQHAAEVLLPQVLQPGQALQLVRTQGGGQPGRGSDLGWRRSLDQPLHQRTGVLVALELQARIVLQGAQAATVTRRYPQGGIALGEQIGQQTDNRLQARGLDGQMGVVVGRQHHVLVVIDGIDLPAQPARIGLQHRVQQRSQRHGAAIDLDVQADIEPAVFRLTGLDVQIDIIDQGDAVAEIVIHLHFPAERFQLRHVLQHEPGPVLAAQDELRSCALQRGTGCRIAVQVEAAQFALAARLFGGVARQQRKRAVAIVDEHVGVIQEAHVFVVFKGNGRKVRPLRGPATAHPCRAVLETVQAQHRRHRADLQRTHRVNRTGARQRRVHLLQHLRHHRRLAGQQGRQGEKEIRILGAHIEQQRPHLAGNGVEVAGGIAQYQALGIAVQVQGRKRQKLAIHLVHLPVQHALARRAGARGHAIPPAEDPAMAAGNDQCQRGADVDARLWRSGTALSPELGDDRHVRRGQVIGRGEQHLGGDFGPLAELDAAVATVLHLAHQHRRAMIDRGQLEDHAIADRLGRLAAHGLPTRQFRQQLRAHGLLQSAVGPGTQRETFIVFDGPIQQVDHQRGGHVFAVLADRAGAVSLQAAAGRAHAGRQVDLYAVRPRGGALHIGDEHIAVAFQLAYSANAPLAAGQRAVIEPAGQILIGVVQGHRFQCRRRAFVNSSF